MISKKTMERVYEYVVQHGEEKASEHFDISLKSVKRYLQLYHQYCGDVVEKEDKIIVTNNEENITNEVEARAYADVGDDYATHRIDVNFRPDGKTQYKIAFVPTKSKMLPTFEDIRERYTELLKGYDTPEFKEKEYITSNQLMTISAFDFHHGKQIWAKETGTEDYDIHISRKTFLEYLHYATTITELFPVDTVLLEVGGDFFNSNGPESATKKGTPQAEDTRYVKTTAFAEEMFIQGIDLLLEHCNTVIVSMIPGNHDYDRLIIFSHFLTAWFRNNPNVIIDDKPVAHKTYRFGDNYLMYTHQMLPNIMQLMASLDPTSFSECRNKVINVGHLHTRKDLVTTRDTDFGVEIIQHPSLIPGDAWSTASGYVSTRQGLIRLFDRDKGKIAEFNYEPHF